MVLGVPILEHSRVFIATVDTFYNDAICSQIL